MLRRAAMLATFALALSGCGAVSTVMHGFRQAEATAEDLQAALGLKPAVGFDWHNGVLTSVNVTFSERPTGKTLDEIAAAARAAVAKEFEQKPTEIHLTFAINP